MKKYLSIGIILASFFFLGTAKVQAVSIGYQPFGSMTHVTGTGFCDPAIILPIDSVTQSAGINASTPCGASIDFNNPPVGSTSGQFAHFVVSGSVSPGSTGEENELAIMHGATTEYTFWADGFFSGNVEPVGLGTSLSTAYYTIPKTSFADSNCDSNTKFASNCFIFWGASSNNRTFNVDGIEMYWDDNATSSAQLLPGAPKTNYNSIYSSTTLSNCGVDVGCILLNVFGIDSVYSTAQFNDLKNSFNSKVPFAYVNAALNVDLSNTATSTAVPNFTFNIATQTGSLSYPHTFTYIDSSNNNAMSTMFGYFRSFVSVVLYALLVLFFIMVSRRIFT